MEIKIKPNLTHSNEDSPVWTWGERANYMLGDIVRLANNLWFVVGDISVDIPNVLVYLAAQARLYLIDSAAGPTIRRSIIKVLNEAGSTTSFTLLNSHGHTDHVGNNDLIHIAQAKVAVA